MSSASPVKLLVCVNRRYGAGEASCAARGGEAVADAIEHGIAERGIAITVERMCCLGKCQHGPNMRIAPGGAFFTRVEPGRVGEVLDALERAAGTISEDDAPPVHLLGS